MWNKIKNIWGRFETWTRNPNNQSWRVYPAYILWGFVTVFILFGEGIVIITKWVWDKGKSINVKRGATMLRRFLWLLIAATLATGAVAVYVTYKTILPPEFDNGLKVLAGGLFGLAVFLLVTPLFKNQLQHNPNQPNKLGLFVKVDTGRAVAIDFGGTFYFGIKGGERPRFTWTLLGLWMLYKLYIWKTTRLHVYVPYFTEPKTYDLPRYVVEGRDGKRIYNVVEKGEEGYRSNHVRIAPFTWYFEFAGAEIQTVPFLIKGSAQVRIQFEKLEDALYKTESWNVLLDQALNAVTRSVVRGNVTLDMVIGKVAQDIWEDDAADDELNQKVADLIMKGVNDYQFDETLGDEFAGKKLVDFGIPVFKIDITDFEDELSDTEREKIRAGIIGRQTGRAKDLDGQGAANAQKHQVDVHKDGGEASKTIINADALVRAANAGSVEALLASFIRRNQ